MVTRATDAMHILRQTTRKSTCPICNAQIRTCAWHVHVKACLKRRDAHTDDVEEGQADRAGYVEEDQGESSL